MKYLALVMALASFDTFSSMPTNGTKVTISGIIVLSEVHLEGKLIKFKTIKLEKEQCFKADGVIFDKAHTWDRHNLFRFTVTRFAKTRKTMCQQTSPVSWAFCAVSLN